MIEQLSFAASLLLPLWNLPLVMQIYRRKSSKDISLWWAFGVWGCLLLMLPTALKSEQLIWWLFGILNFGFFSLVLIAVLLYRGSRP